MDLFVVCIISIGIGALLLLIVQVIKYEHKIRGRVAGHINVNFLTILSCLRNDVMFSALKLVKSERAARVVSDLMMRTGSNSKKVYRIGLMFDYNANILRLLLSQKVDSNSLSVYMFSVAFIVSSRMPTLKSNSIESLLVLYQHRHLIQDIISDSSDAQSANNFRMFLSDLNNYDYASALNKEFKLNRGWIRELYSCLYRPILHTSLKLGSLPADVTYDSRFDTFEGLVYESYVASSGMDVEMCSHVSSFVSKYAGGAGLPEEWKKELFKNVAGSEDVVLSLMQDKAWGKDKSALIPSRMTDDALMLWTQVESSYE